MKKILMISSMILLSACSRNWDIEEVANMPANGNEFDKSLKHEYVELAIVERNYGDWASVDTLLTKAIAASKGYEVPVIRSTDYEVQYETSRQALDHSRQDLIAEFDKGAKTTKPEVSAQAQVSYECIVNGVLREFVDDVIHCEELFNNAMAELKETPVAPKSIMAEPKKVEAVKTEAVKEEVVKEEAPVVVVGAAKTPDVVAKPVNVRDAYMEDGKSYMMKKGQYYVYYAIGHAKPAQNIDSMLKDVVMEYKVVNPAIVEVSGYADTTGSMKLNQALSLRRAKTVANALVKSGIEKEKIETKGYGETHLAVPTADGVAEPLNRRTTIEFK